MIPKQFISILITTLIINTVGCNDKDQNTSTRQNDKLINLNIDTNELLITTSDIIQNDTNNSIQTATVSNFNIEEIFLNDNIETLKQAINNGLDPRKIIEYRGELGITPLHVACASGSNKILRYLMDFNINPNIQDDGGRTLLHTAIIGDNVKTVELLIKMDANVNIKNNQGYTAMDVYLINKSNLDEALSDILKQSKAKRSIEL